MNPKQSKLTPSRFMPSTGFLWFPWGFIMFSFSPSLSMLLISPLWSMIGLGTRTEMPWDTKGQPRGAVFFSAAELYIYSGVFLYIRKKTRPSLSEAHQKLLCSLSFLVLPLQDVVSFISKIHVQWFRWFPPLLLFWVFSVPAVLIWFILISATWILS